MRKILLFWAWLALSAPLALAASSREQGPVDVATAALSEGGAELQLTFLDRTPVNHACEYFVSRFEYVAGIDPGLLLVELHSPEPCLVDRIGRRSGSLKWA